MHFHVDAVGHRTVVGVDRPDTARSVDDQIVEDEEIDVRRWRLVAGGRGRIHLNVGQLPMDNWLGRPHRVIGEKIDREREPKIVGCVADIELRVRRGLSVISLYWKTPRPYKAARISRDG